MTSPSSPVSNEELETTLSRCGARIRAHELSALYAGALCSTDLTVNPLRLMDDILGPEPELGESLEEANRVLQVLMGFWNEVADKSTEGTFRLSEVQVSDLPTREELAALAARRANEVRWFRRGLEAGGDLEGVGERGERVLLHLGEVSDLVSATLDVLGAAADASDAQLPTLAKNLESVTTRTEELMAELFRISSAARADAIVELGDRAA